MDKAFKINLIVVAPLKKLLITKIKSPIITKEAMKQKPILIGQKAPEINYLTSVDDKSIPLSSLKAKYVILIFWSPDCGHCKTEVPLLYKVFEKYKDKIISKSKNLKEVSGKLDRNEIKGLYENGMTQKEITAHFNVTKGAISHIISELGIKKS